MKIKEQISTKAIKYSSIGFIHFNSVLDLFSSLFPLDVGSFIIPCLAAVFSNQFSRDGVEGGVYNLFERDELWQHRPRSSLVISGSCPLAQLQAFYVDGVEAQQ